MLVDFALVPLGFFLLNGLRFNGVLRFSRDLFILRAPLACVCPTRQGLQICIAPQLA